MCHWVLVLSALTRSNEDVSEETERILHPFTGRALGGVEGSDMITEATGF